MAPLMYTIIFLSIATSVIGASAILVYAITAALDKYVVPYISSKLR